MRCRGRDEVTAFSPIEASSKYIDTPTGEETESKKLNLTNRTVRGMIERLKQKLNPSHKKGCTINEKRQKSHKRISSPKRITGLKELEKEEIEKLAPGENIYGIQISNAKDKVGNRLLQRDEAIKAGALGVTTLIYINKKLLFPPTLEEADEIYKQEAKYLKNNSN